MRLIDADKLESGEVIIPTENGRYEYVEVFYKDDVDNAPSVDAVEVVRCKDCKWRGELGCAVSIVDESDIPNDDDFCAWGERKEDGKV